MPEPLSKAAFLVSGGARGITAECVTALARAHGGTFVLIGRTSLVQDSRLDSGASEDALRQQIALLLGERGEKATPIAVEKVLRGVRARKEIEQTLARIEQVGGRAHYLSADVTNGAALRHAVAKLGLGRISGIIHGAGTLADKRIEAKSDQDIASVYATKVHGLRAMLSVVDEASLSYLALFSSTSGYYGNIGQSDYAAANEVLNKFAHEFHRRFPACRTVVFDWGPWDGGMVTPFLKSLFESNGVRVMPVETGARTFVDALSSENSSVQILVNDVGPPQSGPEKNRTSGRPSQPTLRVSRVLRVKDNKLLRDHVIGGNPVLPAACAGLWMANVCQQATSGYRFVSLSDFRVLKGIVFDGSPAERYSAELTDEESPDNTLLKSVVITSTTRDQKQRYHYRGIVRLAQEPPSAPEPRQFELTVDPRFESMKPYASGALFHGPAFQAITRVIRMSSKESIVECQLPRTTAEIWGQFSPLAFDAVALDTLLQCLGLWAHHEMGAAALPTSWSSYEMFAQPTNGRFYATAEVEDRGDLSVRASLYMHDADGQIFAQVTGVEFTVHRPIVVAPAPATKTTTTVSATGAASNGYTKQPATTLKTNTTSGISNGVSRIEHNPATTKTTNTRLTFDRKGVVRLLREVEDAAFVVRADARIGVTRDRGRGEEARSRGELLAELPANPPSRFGSASFRREYGVDCAYMAGAMAKGIASEELVIALGRAGLLGSFGAGGLSIERIEQSVVRITQALPTQPHAFNLLHSPRKLATEDATVDVYLKHGVRTVEASSYIDLTPAIVRYRVAGLSQSADGTIIKSNRVIVKLSRVELARRFMAPPPGKIVQALLEAGKISKEQAELALHVPMADDVTVEGDSGGHTDNRPLLVLLPAMLALRDELQREHRYPTAIRVGAAGGIATPQSMLAAFTIGADYAVTGSINQACIEAGTSEYVKQLLSSVSMTDVMMSPESDMFEHGVRVQVVKQRCLFPMRAQKLYNCYQTYESLDAIPDAVRQELEQQIFQGSLDAIWKQTSQYLAAHKPEQLVRAENPRVKMALLFKWYMGQSSRWAVEATPERELDYQIWCGPGMGAFNSWARGSYLELPENRRVTDVARVLLWEAAYLHRVQQLRLAGLTNVLNAEGAE